MAEQHETDQAHEGCQRAHAQRGRELRGQIRAGRRELHGDGRNHRGDPGGDQRGLEAAAVEERKRECDRHDRRGGEGRDRRWDRRRHEDRGEHRRDEEDDRALRAPDQELPSSVDRGRGEHGHDHGSGTRCQIVRLDIDHQADDSEGRRCDRHRDGEAGELPCLLGG